MVAPKKPFLPKEPFAQKFLNFYFSIYYENTIGLFKFNRYCVILKIKGSGK